MADFSSVVVVEVDEAGRPTSLRAFAEGDTIASSVITSSITQAVEITYDRSSTWEAGGEATLTTAVSAPWQNTFNYTDAASADIDNSRAYVDSASGNINSTSSLVTTNNASWTSAYDYSLSVWQTTVDNSGTWQAGGEATIPADVSGPWENTYNYIDPISGNIDEARTVTGAGVSGPWQNTFNYIDPISGSIDEARTVTAASVSGPWENTFNYIDPISGSIEEARTVTGASVSGPWQNTFNYIDPISGNIDEARTVTGAAVSGPWQNTFNYIDPASANIDEAVTVTSVSGTNFLGGATPTLSNDLNCSSNDVTGATQFRVRNNNLACFAGEANIEVSAAGDVIHRSGRSITIKPAFNDALSGTSVLSIFTPVRVRLGSESEYIEFNNSATTSSLNYLLSGVYSVSTTVFDNSSSWTGGGGGGSFEGSAIASGFMVTEASTVEASGADGGSVDAPKDGFVLTLDTAAEKVAFKKIPFTVDSAGGAITLGSDVNTDASFDIEDVTINQTNGDFIQGDGYIIGRRIHASTELSAAGTITLSGAVSVSSTSSIDISAMPVPAPMIYIQMNIDGSYESAETNFADGVTPTQVKNRVDLLSWDNTNKVVDVSATGYYEVLTNMVLETSANVVHNTAIYRNGAVQNRIQNMPIRSVNDPQDVGVMCCFYAEAGDTIKVTTDCTSGSNAIKQKAGSSLLVRRLF